MTSESLFVFFGLTKNWEEYRKKKESWIHNFKSHYLLFYPPKNLSQTVMVANLFSTRAKQAGSQMHYAINHSLLSCKPLPLDKWSAWPQSYWVTQRPGISRTVPISHNYLFFIDCPTYELSEWEALWTPPASSTHVQAHFHHLGWRSCATVPPAKQEPAGPGRP